jgi:hypothetical protein
MQNSRIGDLLLPKITHSQKVVFQHVAFEGKQNQDMSNAMS